MLNSRPGENVVEGIFVVVRVHDAGVDPLPVVLHFIEHRLQPILCQFPTLDSLPWPLQKDCTVCSTQALTSSSVGQEVITECSVAGIDDATCRRART